MKQSLTHYQPFLIWVWFNAIVVTVAWVLWDRGLLWDLLISDSSRVCFMIVVCLIAGSLFAGWRSFYLSQQWAWLSAYRETGQWSCKGRSLSHFYMSQMVLLRSPSEGQQVAELMAERAKGAHQIGWFMTSLELKLGLLGTIIGFVMMLSSLQGLEDLDFNEMKILMKNMTQGMGVAMNTTLVGLVASIFLGIQYLLLDRFADGLLASTVEHSWRDHAAKSSAQLD